ncbi:MAG TPA: hypothetical protein VJR47_19235 [Stellaceae bacterium]|nr:hypothetical protein [Stellaceae bacterium]
MIAKRYFALRLAFPVAVVTLAALAPLPARADFFDDMRKTFTTDIPHFFQDDIPCTFGGKPTSGTKTSCNNKPAKAAPAPAPSKPQNTAVPPESPSPNTGTTTPPPSSGQ